MKSEEYKSLSSVKEQVEKMFHAINNLESKEKNEAFGYLRKYLDGEHLDTRKDTIHKNASDNSRNVKAIRSKQTTSTEKRTRHCARTSNWKLKFKNQILRVKRPSLKCRTCGERSKTKKLLLKHLETHIGTPISCRHCKIGFNCRTSYLCHISLKMCKISKVIVKKYICDQCQKAFRFKRHFERHVEGHKRNNCTYCDVRLTRRKQLVHHLSTVHSIKLERAMFKCEHCEKRYESSNNFYPKTNNYVIVARYVKKRSLYHHLKQHAEDKIVCMECGTLSTTAQAHADHYAVHDKDRPWKCEKCNDSFYRRQQYLIHMKRHDRYKCITCNETFASKARVLRHKQRGHHVQGLEPQMKCPHCPVAFQRRLSLQIHLRKHLDDKIMYCKYCDKNFRSPYLYFKHCTTTEHDTNSPEKRQLVCDLCGKLFVKKYQLEQHLHRVHDDTKQVYTCEYCGHTTTNRVNMDRHLSLHLEDKKEIICDQCGKAFYNITTLKDHIAYVHSQERHFKCTECDKAFKRNSELVRHKTSHSDLRPHVCDTCGVSYKRSTHLRRHEESQHGTTTKNRRVQRLTKDENGQLVPVPEQKKPKPKSKKKNSTVPSAKQVFSIMDAQSGEMVTFTLPQVSNETVTTVLNINNQSFGPNVLQPELPYQPTGLVLNPTDNIILASELASQSTTNLVTSVDQTFANQLIDNAQFASSSYLPTNILPSSVQIQNSTTCDILLPENRILNQQSQQNPPGNYAQDTYQFLYYER